MELRIRVGAATDASFNQVFRALPEAASDANRKVTTDTKQQTALQTALLKSKWAQEKEILKGQVDATSKMHAALNAMEVASNTNRLKIRQASAQKAIDIEVNAAKEGARKTAEIEIATAKETARKERELAVVAAREAALAARPPAGGGRGRDTANRVGYWSMRNFAPVTPMLSYAGRMASDLAHGAGVDFNLGSMFSNRTSAQQMAADVANSGYMAGDKRNGQRVSSAALMADAMNAGNKGAFSQQDALGGLQQFTGLTGDLQTGRDILEKMSVYARATGTGLGDMMAASGNVSNALGDVENKGEIISKIMASIAGQGKLSAVEVSDMATQMAKLAAVAPQFQGNVADNIVMMGSLAQEARQRGGAASATQAATSVMSFTNTFAKGARRNEFHAAGITLGDEKGGKLRGVDELMLEMLDKTHGQTSKMGKLIMDSGARRVSRGFESIYKDASGGKGLTDPAAHAAGLKAVADEFARLKKAAIDETEMSESHKRAMETDAAKAQLFQNQLQEATNTMATSLIPQMEKLAPVALEVFEAFGKVTGWLAQNPFAILPVALTAAIAKAGIEQTIRAGIEGAFKSGGSGGVGGNVAAGFLIASIAVTTFTVGTMVVDNLFKKEEDKQKAELAAGFEGGNAESKLAYEMQHGGPSDKTISEAQAAAQKLGKSNEEEKKGPGFIKELVESFIGMSGTKEELAAVDAEKARRDAQLLEHNKDQARLLDLIHKALQAKSAFIGPPAPPGDGGGTTNTGAPKKP